MGIIYAFVVILAFLLMVYLFYALIQPEKF